MKAKYLRSFWTTVLLLLLIVFQPSFLLVFLVTSFVIALYKFHQIERFTMTPKSLVRITRELFSEANFWHPSAKVDTYSFTIIALIVLFFLGLHSVEVYTLVRESFYGFITSHVPLASSEYTNFSGFYKNLIYTFILFLSYDIVFFFHHVAHHKIPLLWRFHRVHHSAKVLIPTTTFRIHPVEVVSFVMLISAFTGLIQAIFDWWSGYQMTIITIVETNIFLFIFYLSGYHLRHSHISIIYPAVLSHIFISPRQHQIHHSCLEEHIDKNYGLVFALWDWFFGSLHLPKQNEICQLGIANAPTKGYSGSILLLLWQPIKENWEENRFQLIIYLSVLVYLVKI